MDRDQQEVVIAELLDRVRRLEAKPRRRIYNQQQAAERLNMSVTKLRGLRALGRGPKGRRNGRVWEITDDALAAYEQEGDAA